ncbi:hypothetical protein [Mesoterricola silvestris]|uniref:Secreted protein n=1 Tax=Mesoterricola silvestris TaxID=2927979 RepID=A0AA48H6G6_9BACT|nr:hypothetical protein [Mesoterricola silvestris]BDU72723.1 hypothetical protein METEAL_18970 [Mesoterricola silvestris]
MQRLGTLTRIAASLTLFASSLVAGTVTLQHRGPEGTWKLFKSDAILATDRGAAPAWSAETLEPRGQATLDVSRAGTLEFYLLDENQVACLLTVTTGADGRSTLEARSLTWPTYLGTAIQRPAEDETSTRLEIRARTFGTSYFGSAMVPLALPRLGAPATPVAPRPEAVPATLPAQADESPLPAVRVAALDPEPFKEESKRSPETLPHVPEEPASPATAPHIGGFRHRDESKVSTACGGTGHKAGEAAATAPHGDQRLLETLDHVGSVARRLMKRVRAHDRTFFIMKNTGDQTFDPHANSQREELRILHAIEYHLLEALEVCNGRVGEAAFDTLAKGFQTQLTSLKPYFKKLASVDRYVQNR